jgi:Asp-tRNA(Asn)/Glu-tRNA(Gln) amidotransferase A subunit family amidase
MDVTAGPSPCDHFSLPKPQENYEKLIDTLEVQGLRAAWSADYGYIPTDPECIAVGRQSAEALVESASLKWIEIEVRLSSARTPANRLSAALLRGELELNGYWPANVKQLSEYIAHDMEGAGTLGPIDLARSEEATRKLDYEAAQLFEKIDVLFCPVTAVVSLPAQGPSPSIIGGKDARATGAEAHLTAWNLTGLPAISVPAGHSKFGFPIGLQIVCARGRDDLALRLARILEIVRPWPHFAPDYRMRIS